MFVSTYYYYYVICTCWPLLSNLCFDNSYTNCWLQDMGAGDHNNNNNNYGRLMIKGVMGLDLSWPGCIRSEL